MDEDQADLFNSRDIRVDLDLKVLQQDKVSAVLATTDLDLADLRALDFSSSSSNSNSLVDPVLATCLSLSCSISTLASQSSDLDLAMLRTACQSEWQLRNKLLVDLRTFDTTIMCEIRVDKDRDRLLLLALVLLRLKAVRLLVLLLLVAPISSLPRFSLLLLKKLVSR
jgi:hypothetical protein